jgi:hypothetical protein
MLVTSENEKQNNLEQIKTVALSVHFRKTFSSKNVRYIYILVGRWKQGRNQEEASGAELGPAKYFKFLNF